MNFLGITYWSANFVWDLANYCISIGFCIIIFLGFNVEAYVYQTNFLCLFLLLFLYGFAIIPLMYPINYLFRTPSTGFVVISSINIFIGLATTISTVTLESFTGEPDLQKINDKLTKVFLIFPHYCLGRGLFDLSKTHGINVISAKYGSLYLFLFAFFVNNCFFVGFSYKLCSYIAITVQYYRQKSCCFID